MGVEHVEVGLARELGVEVEPEQPPVPVAVDVGAQVGHHRGGAVVEPVEHLDAARLLGHEDAAVDGEAHHGRVVQAGDDDPVLESGGKGLGLGGGGADTIAGAGGAPGGRPDRHPGERGQRADHDQGGEAAPSRASSRAFPSPSTPATAPGWPRARERLHRELSADRLPPGETQRLRRVK